MPADRTLAPLLQWMQAVVTYPGSVEAALAQPETKRFIDPERLADVVLPSARLDPIARVGIYHGMYMMRMVEALQADYPALEHAAGEHAFSHLVEEFVVQHPSGSYTLNRLGDALPQFISESELPRRKFLYDLARFELAMTQVFDEEQREPLAAGAISAVSAEDLERIRFTPIPALRLLELQYDVVASFQAFLDDEPARGKRVRTFVVVYRQDYSVLRMTLEKPAFTLLRLLVDGQTLGAALQKFQKRLHRFPDQLELFDWFRQWSAAGLFAAMDRVSEDGS